MKKLILSLTLGLALGASGQIQTNNLPSIFNQIQDFGTKIDTNSTLFSVKQLTVWLGNKYVDNSINSSSLGLDYTLYQSTNGLYLSLESETMNAGIAGTLVSQQGGIGFGKGIHDFRFGGFLDGGYDFNNGRMFGEFGLDVRKGTGNNTFLFTRIGQKFMSKKNYPSVELGVGFRL